MGPKTFTAIVEHMFPIRKQYFGFWGEYFDYPDYGGLPKKISNRLSPEAVDALQNVLQEGYSRKSQFARAYKNRLSVLGEPMRGKRI